MRSECQSWAFPRCSSCRWSPSRRTSPPWRWTPSRTRRSTPRPSSRSAMPEGCLLYLLHVAHGFLIDLWADRLSPSHRFFFCVFKNSSSENLERALKLKPENLKESDVLRLQINFPGLGFKSRWPASISRERPQFPQMVIIIICSNSQFGGTC